MTKYKTRCDYHPKRKAVWAFTEKATGERRGLCSDCFEDEREEALRHLNYQQRKKRKK
jgi:hypothetical protein